MADPQNSDKPDFDDKASEEEKIKKAVDELRACRKGLTGIMMKINLLLATGPKYSDALQKQGGVELMLEKIAAIDEPGTKDTPPEARIVVPYIMGALFNESKQVRNVLQYKLTVWTMMNNLMKDNVSLETKLGLLVVLTEWLVVRRQQKKDMASLRAQADQMAKELAIDQQTALEQIKRQEENEAKYETYLREELIKLTKQMENQRRQKDFKQTPMFRKLFARITLVLLYLYHLQLEDEGDQKAADSEGETYKEKCDRLEMEMINQQEITDENQKKVDDLQKLYDEQQKEKELMLSQNKLLQNEIAELLKQIPLQQKKFTEESQLKDQETSRLSGLLEQRENEREELLTIIAAHEKQISDDQEANDKENNRLKGVLKEKEDLNSELQKKIADQEKQLKDEIEQENQEKQRLNDIVKQKENENAELLKKIEQQEQKITEEEQLKELEAQKMNQIMKEKQQEKEELLQKLAEQEKKLAEEQQLKEEENKRFTGIVEEKENENADLIKKIALQEQKFNEDSETKGQQKERLDGILDQKEKEIEELHKQIEELNKTVDSLEKKLNEETQLK
ncbi:MAG: hypothetical protein EZS28_032560, partial [Streblomastix strix]